MNTRWSSILACTLILIPAASVLATELPDPALDLPAVAEAPAAGIEIVSPPEIESVPEPEPAAQQCPPEGCEPEPSPFYCQESDYGNNPSMAGTLWFFYYGQIVGVYHDTCLNGTNLREYWCNGSSNWTTTTFWCTNGCSAGRCL